MKSMHVFSAVGLVVIAAATLAQTSPSGQNTDWSYLQNRSAAVAQKRLGTPAAATEVGRVIDISSTTRWINVREDEVVRIRSGGRSFDWRFATWNVVSFELAQIAPPDFPVNPGLRVYVAENPLYRGQ